MLDSGHTIHCFEATGFLEDEGLKMAALLATLIFFDQVIRALASFFESPAGFSFL